MIKVGNVTENVNYHILLLVEEENLSYLAATIKYYNEFAEEDDLNKFIKLLDSDIVKEIEKEAYEDGLLKSFDSVDITQFFD